MKPATQRLTAFAFCIAIVPSMICETARVPLGTASTGAITSGAQTNRYVFTGNAGDVVHLTVAVTNGNMGPKVVLLTSDGTVIASKSSAGVSIKSLEMDEISLPSSADGVYVVEIGDRESANSGNYSLFVQKTKNPDGALGILWGEEQNSLINASAYRDTYTFAGTAHDVVDLSAASTSGSLGPKIRVFGPDGALLSSPQSATCGGSHAQLNRISLPASGNYTVLVGDCSGMNTGTYNLTTRCSGVCLLPSPSVTSVSPASKPAGGQAFTLKVNGSNFVKSNGKSVVQWNGTELPTTFISNSQLVVHVPASYVEKAGTFPITVLTTAGDAGSSDAVSFPVHNPAPALTGVFPVKARVGASTLTLTVKGANFVPGSIVRWNGNALETRYSHANQLTATVPASSLAGAGKATISVFNSNPGGGASAVQVFDVENSAPTVTSLSPAGTTVGHAGLTLTVSGSNFLPTSTIEWNGAGLPTTYVSGSQLLAQIPAVSLSVAGTVVVNVMNPSPGGGLSESAKNFTIGPPAASPFFRLAGGTYGTTQTLVLTDSTPDAVIHYTYTAGGAVPTASSAVYHGPITIATTGIVEAIASAPGFSQSAVSSKSYVIAPSTQTAAPYFSLAGGEYYSAQMLLLTDATPGATIYFTTNGATPTTASTVYTGAIAIRTSMILKAVAMAPGHSLSSQTPRPTRSTRTGWQPRPTSAWPEEPIVPLKRWC